MERVNIGWWIAAAIVFGFIESLTMSLAISSGVYTISMAGAFSYVIFKIVIFLVLIFAAYEWVSVHNWVVAATLCAAGGVLSLAHLLNIFTKLLI